MTDAGVRLTDELFVRERALAGRDPALVDEPLADLLDDAFFGSRCWAWARRR